MKLPKQLRNLGVAALLSAPCQFATDLKVERFISDASVRIAVDGRSHTLHTGESAAAWTFVGTASPYAILEDFSRQDGHIVFADSHGIQLDLPKSLEPTSVDSSKLYLGHSFDDVLNSAHDLLGEAILAKPGDPEYSEVAQCFQPIQKIKTYTFVGTHGIIDKVGFQYGGRTPDFDPAAYDTRIPALREQHKVWDGLVGGWLPVLRFVYPQDDANWTELVAFAPLHTENGNDRIQPVWYRVSRIEGRVLKWARYFDSYHPFPPHLDADPHLFYRDLAALHKGWTEMLKPGMQIQVPDDRVGNMARYSIVRDMMTRVGDFPKYGAFDKDYAGSEHDGFPDTFTVDTAAMLEWGLVELAGRYIENYFSQFVRDDGSILYRGPETGQYGRMLTVTAQYVSYGGDPQLLVRQRRRIDGVTNLLLSMRDRAKQLPRSSPAFGLIAGWSEADACLDPDPPRYMQPYFSNSTEAARGFRDLGRVWEKIGRETKNDELAGWGKKLVVEASELQADIQRAIERSLLKDGDETILPSIAGVKEPFHVVVPRDVLDPQFRSYRAYMEMMYSGSLTRDQVQTIVHYRATHHDTILGVPTAYGYKTGELAGFLSYGHGYGLIQHDLTREALLMLYGVMAHQYTRGTWTAPETRSVIPDRIAAPYCTPAQLVQPLMTRWLLVFEDPQSDTLWLGKALPRHWLEDGKTTSVSAAPTRWGRISFSIASNLRQGEIRTQLSFPTEFGAATKLRLRAPGDRRIMAVTLNGKSWPDFDSASETISIPPHPAASVRVIAHYH